MTTKKDSKTKTITKESQNTYENNGNCLKCGCQLITFSPEYRNEDGTIRFVPCSDCFPEEYEREKRRYIQIVRQKRIEKRFGESCLSPRFLVKTFENFDASDSNDKKLILGKCRKFAEDFPEKQKKAHGLPLWGLAVQGKATWRLLLLKK